MGRQGISVRHSENVVLRGNRILDANDGELGRAGLTVSGSAGVRVE
jgi:hypothetical protein